MDRNMVLSIVSAGLIVVGGLVRRIPWAGASLAVWLSSLQVAEWVTDQVLSILDQLGATPTNVPDVAAVRAQAEGYAAQDAVMGAAPPPPEKESQ